MDIYEILIKKRDMLLSSGDPLCVEFSLEDINVLSDINQLRTLKLKTPFPDSYESSEDLFDCSSKIINDEGGIYKILEFCVFRNRVLKPAVTQVFKELMY